MYFTYLQSSTEITANWPRLWRILIIRSIIALFSELKGIQKLVLFKLRSLVWCRVGITMNAIHAHIHPTSNTLKCIRNSLVDTRLQSAICISLSHRKNNPAYMMTICSIMHDQEVRTKTQMKDQTENRIEW